MIISIACLLLLLSNTLHENMEPLYNELHDNKSISIMYECAKLYLKNENMQHGDEFPHSTVQNVLLVIDLLLFIKILFLIYNSPLFNMHNTPHTSIEASG